VNCYANAHFLSHVYAVGSHQRMAEGHFPFKVLLWMTHLQDATTVDYAMK